MIFPCKLEQRAAAGNTYAVTSDIDYQPAEPSSVNVTNQAGDPPLAGRRDFR
jgi:hypothetical protein